MIMRDPREDPPTLHVVDPHGRIRAVPIAAGIAHTIVDQAGVIRPEMRAAGFVTLEELHELEGPAGGFAVYCDYVAAKKAGKRAKEPTDWLPPTVIRRRAEAPTANDWTPPTLPTAAKATKARSGTIDAA